MIEYLLFIPYYIEYRLRCLEKWLKEKAKAPEPFCGHCHFTASYEGSTYDSVHRRDHSEHRNPS